jgi:Pyridoxal phosphate biosynthesis protein
MKFNPIIMVAGEPNSIFLEIFFKVLKKIKVKSPIILIASVKILKLQMKKLKFKKKIKILNLNNLFENNLNNNCINLIDVDYKSNVAFEKISNKSNKYISKCFDIAFEILKTKKLNKFINGPIAKKTFLKKKYLGITEYIQKL